MLPQRSEVFSEIRGGTSTLHFLFSQVAILSSVYTPFEQQKASEAAQHPLTEEWRNTKPESDRGPLETTLCYSVSPQPLAPP